MKSCLFLTSLDLPALPAEAQEIVNLLTRHNYTINLLQTNVSSLELYRALRPYSLVWIASHAAADGFHFGATLIEPLELGQFLNQAETKDLVLNSCFSGAHVETIQSYANCNVLATIAPEIKDALAWTSALYLAQALTATNSLREAYQQVLAGRGSAYRFYPAPKVQKRMDLQQSDLEKNMEWMLRVMSGDPHLHSLGVLDNLEALKLNFEAHVRNHDAWQQSMEVRIKVLEASSPGNTLILTRQTVRLLLSFLIMAVLLLFFLVYLLRG